ncbi:2-hydroxyacid dehydrogenase [Comamonadaceae bacterium G21597-S1]|nr:2-hydroxyacid dehydrogenase [Comamonadaceae bacterium G21597-S1]
MIPTIAVSFKLEPPAQAVLAEAVAVAARITALPGLDAAARATALRQADIVLSRHPRQELTPQDLAAMGGVGLIQLMTAGIDFIAPDDLPAGVPVASNAGAYSEPMAEHALAMILAAAKRLLVEHAALAHGDFHQFKANRMLRGMVCGILGYGGIGQATARLMRGIGASIHVINRSGTTRDAVDWIGTTAQLDTLLAVSDVLLISMPLTRDTQGLIGQRELGLMKDDAILVNLARGEIIDEAALFAHLQSHPAFTACIDAWWVEPVRHGEFRMDHPFTALPNVIGSPHNSASVQDTANRALHMAGLNCRRQLTGAPVLNLVRPQDRYL